MQFDLILRGGSIIDGSGNPPFYADVGINKDKICYVGKIGSDLGEREIDVSGKIISPGFIDLHSHSDLALLEDPLIKPKIMQGITTEIVGQDGVGAAPINEEMIDMQKDLMSGWTYPEALNVEWTWRSITEYLDAMESKGTSINVGTLIPHGNIRQLVMGMENREPTDKEITEMQNLIKDCLDEGAMGLSTGLIYLPCAFATEEELTKLCEVVGEYGGIFDIHVRGYSHNFLDSVNEAIRIAESTESTLHLCHFGVAGKENWHKLERVFSVISEKRKQGVNIVGDLHSYPAGSTSLGAAALPPSVTSKGADFVLDFLRKTDNRARMVDMLDGTIPSNFDNWIRYNGYDGVIISGVHSEKNKFAEGKTVTEVSKLLDKSPADTILDLIIEDTLESNSPFSISCIVFWSNDDICSRILKDDYFGVGTDALLIDGNPHPRCYGTFPRVIDNFTKQRKDITLEKAIQKMTSLAARIMGVNDRGIINPGYYADIVVFDPKNIQDNARYIDPRQHSSGIKYVIVNGQIVVEDGQHTGALPGRTIRRKWAIS
ncbi:N-acyl-D-amino-acid deacylase family protein [Virgibacillus kimchii]